MDMMTPNFFLDRTKQHLIFMTLLQSHLVNELQNAENLKINVTLKDIILNAWATELHVYLVKKCTYIHYQKKK
jgi:hypothetical protein